MKGDPQVISYLNQYLTIELTGHKQYFLHSRRCAQWGLPRLQEIQHNYSGEEMRHAERILQRILFLEGQPTLQDCRPIEVHTTVAAQLQLDLELVTLAAQLLRQACAYCLSKNDHVSAKLFQEMLADEESHTLWLETQLALIQKAGLPNYLQSQM